MFFIYTGNKNNQILIFETYKEAHDWLKRCTRLSDEEIENAIKTPRKIGECWAIYE